MKIFSFSTFTYIAKYIKFFLEKQAIIIGRPLLDPTIRLQRDVAVVPKPELV